MSRWPTGSRIHAPIRLTNHPCIIYPSRVLASASGKADKEGIFGHPVSALMMVSTRRNDMLSAQVIKRN